MRSQTHCRNSLPSRCIVLGGQSLSLCRWIADISQLGRACLAVLGYAVDLSRAAHLISGDLRVCFSGTYIFSSQVPAARLTNQGSLSDLEREQCKRFFCPSSHLTQFLHWWHVVATPQLHRICDLLSLAPWGRARRPVRRW